MISNKIFSSLTKLDHIVPGLVAVSLIISCKIISTKKYFWNDELYSYYLLADQSFSHMLAAFHDKINNTPPLYFLLGWFWARVFGSTELSLRLFSSLGMCTACVIVWLTLRRTYNLWSASIGVVSVFCTSSIILKQNAEARMYGLFLAVCSLGLIQYDSINRSLRPTWSTLLVNTCIHAAIVNTHLFGLFYSGAIVFSLIVRDIHISIFRPRVYLSVILSWLSLTLYIPSFLNQADAGNPRSWVPTPLLKDLTDLISLSSSSFVNISVVVILIIISGLQFILSKNKGILHSQTNKQNHQISAEISLLIFAYTFLLVPVFVWVISRTIRPIFSDRYMLPSALSWTILLAYLSSCIISADILNKQIFTNLRIPSFFIATRKTLLLLGLTITLLFYPISYAKSYQGRYLPGANDNKYGYKNLPVVVQASAQFLERRYYSPEADRYFFILDRQAAVDSNSGQFGLQEYKHLNALKSNYPELFKNHILESKDFLNQYNRFLVLDYLNYNKSCPLEAKGSEWTNIHCPQWLEMRIITNPNYHVTPLGEIYGETLLLVESQQ